MDQQQEFKYQRARKRVEEIKGFRIHFTIYLAINLLIALGNGISNGSAGKPVFQYYMLFTPVIWGMGLGIHALRVFVANRVFSTTWEARQMAKFMNEERQEKTTDPSKFRNP